MFLFIIQGSNYDYTACIILQRQSVSHYIKRSGVAPCIYITPIISRPYPLSPCLPLRSYTACINRIKAHQADFDALPSLSARLNLPLMTGATLAESIILPRYAAIKLFRPRESSRCVPNLPGQRRGQTRMYAGTFTVADPSGIRRRNVIQELDDSRNKAR